MSLQPERSEGHEGREIAVQQGQRSERQRAPLLWLRCNPSPALRFPALTVSHPLFFASLRCASLRTPLTPRNYADNKIEENITAEIMLTCLTETRESYDEQIVVELKSDGSGGDDEVEANVGRIEAWIQQWTKDRAEGVH